MECWINFPFIKHPALGLHQLPSHPSIHPSSGLHFLNSTVFCLMVQPQWKLLYFLRSGLIMARLSKTKLTQAQSIQSLTCHCHPHLPFWKCGVPLMYFAYLNKRPIIEPFEQETLVPVYQILLLEQNGLHTVKSGFWSMFLTPLKMGWVSIKSLVTIQPL